MRIHCEDGTSAEPHIDMTPMIDTLFNLVIFFLIATTFQQLEREMKIALPFAGVASPITAQLRELVLNVNPEGRIIANGREIAPETVATMIKDAVAANPQQKVTVRGDRAAAYQHIVRVLDICKQSGIQQPYLDTVLAK